MQREGGEYGRLREATRLLMRGHFEELKGPFIIIFSALDSASVAETVSPFVLPIDPKGFNPIPSPHTEHFIFNLLVFLFYKRMTS